MKIRDIIVELESLAPAAYQEPYDNSGLIIGSADWKFKGSLLCLDSTEEVIDEAVERGLNMVIAHHPILFKGIKRITGKHYTERALIKAIKHDIAIYAIHTNLDNVRQGVNEEFADRIGLIKEGRNILMPKQGELLKLEVLCPPEQATAVQEAIWEAGAGKVGHYERCSFSFPGIGRFKPIASARPHIGEVGKDEETEELKLEFLLASHLSSAVLAAMRSAHPYEEVAYFMTALENQNQHVGSGIIGEMKAEMEPEDFLAHLKSSMSLKTLKYTRYLKGKVKRVALLGGSGIFGLEAAKSAGAQAFITADVKYHEFFEADGDLLLVDIGHYESEQYTRELLQRNLLEKFPTFAHLLTKVNTNPVKYL